MVRRNFNCDQDRTAVPGFSISQSYKPKLFALRLRAFQPPNVTMLPLFSPFSFLILIDNNKCFFFRNVSLIRCLVTFTNQSQSLKTEMPLQQFCIKISTRRKKVLKKISKFIKACICLKFGIIPQPNNSTLISNNRLN